MGKSRSESETKRTLTKHKGYWLRVLTEDSVYSRLGLKHIAECLYYIDRYYKQLPNLVQVDIMLGDYCKATFKKEELQMGALTAYREANPVTSGTFLPNLDQKENKQYNRKAGPGKVFVAKAGLTFTISDGLQSDHGEWSYIDYTITFEDTPAYRNAATFTDIERTYILSLPETQDRIKQLDILRQHYIGKNLPLKLVQVGKGFDITDAE